MPKDTSRDKQRHGPLHVDYAHGNGSLRANPRAKDNRKSTRADQQFVDAKQSRKILQLAKEQQEEIEEEEGQVGGLKQRNYELENLEDGDAWEDEVDSDESDYEEDSDFAEIEEIEIDEEDEALYNKYVEQEDDDDEENDGPFSGTGNMTLAEKIMQKVREREMEQQAPAEKDSNGPAAGEGVMLPPKVIEVYSKIGELLSSYRSGKLPKAFKMIPKFKKWEDILYVTQPDSWTPHAIYQGTRVFVSALKGGECRRFVEMVLLPRFREDIEHTKTVNYHLYRAVKKSLYKPAGFFRGFLFPLCDQGCTLKEAAIVGSVLSKVSIPIEHSSVALLKLCEMPYSGSNSYFIKTLIDKKYALPYKVVDACVYHFMQFRTEADKKMPVIWQQSLLSFAQKYKNDITPEQRDVLLDTVKVHFHKDIGPEVRRELIAGQPRGGDIVMEQD